MRFLLSLPVATLIFAGLSSLALAQDADGNDTAGNWKVTHFETFGIWLSSCDERASDTGLLQRCYIRHVDVFSPAPKFAAQFLFVTNEDDGPQVDFGLEAGTFFAPGQFRIERNSASVWSTLRPGCLTGLACRFGGDEGRRLLEEMAAGGAFRFTFRDRHGSPQDLTWPLDGFAEAMGDFARQSQARALID